MATRLSKNTFAKLFPAMAEDPDISTKFINDVQDGGGFSQYDPNEYADTPASDPDRPAPSTPTTRSPFAMPSGAYTPPQPQQPVDVNDPPGADPMAIDTLVKIGQDSAAGRVSPETRAYPYRDIAGGAGSQAPPDNSFFRKPATSEGTDTFGDPYKDPADQPPPALPANMRPKPQTSALDAAKERVRKLRTEAPVDRNKGGKSRAWEAVQNVLAGMAMAYKQNPNAHYAGILAGGAAGGIGGAINKTWNEQREQEVALGRAEQDYESLNSMATDEEKLAVSQNKREVDVYEAMTKREKLVFDQLDERKKNVLSQLRDIDEIDPDSKDPNVQEFIKQAKAAGIVVTKKAKGSKFSFDITPDGQLVIGDTTTGAYKKGQGNYSKPPSFTANELPDEMFGIKGEKDLDDEATAGIAKEFPQRRRVPEVERNLLEMKDEAGNFTYRNPDGSLNESQAVQDGIITPDKLYENSPSNYEQRIAQSRTSGRAKQAALKAEVANFRTAVSNQRPRSDAQEQPISKVKDLFLRIMQLPPKQRAAKLKAFYENLPNIRITG